MSGLKTQVRRLTMRQVMDVIEGTGITAPANVGMDSTAHIPQSNELEGRKATDINGAAQFQVVRTPGRYEADADPIVVATADPVKGAEVFGEWMRIYSGATLADRANMLGNTEWVEVQKANILQSVAAPRQSESGYTSKVVLKPSTTNSAVQMGESEAGKKRLSWNGHSGFSLARWMGANGWTGSEARKTFEAIHLPMGETAITGGVYAGKAGKRGEPAKVTDLQATELRAILAKVRAATPAKDTKVEEPKVVDAPKPTTPAPTPAPVVQAPEGKGSKRKAKDAKLAKAMADRKKAGKR